MIFWAVAVDDGGDGVDEEMVMEDFGPRNKFLKLFGNSELADSRKPVDVNKARHLSLQGEKYWT